MKLIVGLGNPGKKYELSRHNIGFLCLERLAQRLHCDQARIRHESLLGETLYQGEKVLLLKPQTFMNASGRALRKTMDYYGLGLEDLLVIYDDVDLDFGVLRMRMKGGAGTHNGMRDILLHLGSEDFARLRVGIGKNPGDIVGYVLSSFNAAEKKELPAIIDRAAAAAEDFLRLGIVEAMNRNNG